VVNNLSTEITALYNITNEIQTVASINADVENVANNEINVTTVASMQSDINDVVAIKSDIEWIADNDTIVTNVSNNSTKIATVANNISSVNTTATNITDINTVASISSNVTSVAGNATNINTAANNIAAIIDAPNQAASAAASAEAAAQSAEISAPPPMLTHIWSDHLFNDVRYLRADTFSWQDGTVYTNAYDHLVDDVTNGTSQTEIIAGHTITYTLADDGHKIVSDTYASEVESLYNDTGVAWYYILDLVNHRFKLPRENPTIEILEQSAPVIGTGKTLGFTNGTDVAGLVGDNSSYNHHIFRKSVIGKDISTSLSGTSEGAIDGIIGVTTDGEKSGLKADLSRKTGIYKGKLYLYFYIGQFSQTATEQTAGLNSELFNSKVDIDLSNINPIGQKVLDGQWVVSTLSLASDVTQNTTTEDEYDISSYLPNDSYNYELLIDGNCSTASSSGKISLIALKTDLVSVDNVLLCQTISRASSTFQAGGSMILPVGPARTVIKATYANNTGTYSLRIKAYRRIGTNS
jgi:hypothetical protein